MFCLCFNLSWYRHRGDSSSCASAHCFNLRFQEESQTGGQVTEQRAQYANHAVNAQLCQFQVKALWISVSETYLRL